MKRGDMVVAKCFGGVEVLRRVVNVRRYETRRYTRDVVDIIMDRDFAKEEAVGFPAEDVRPASPEDLKRLGYTINATYGEAAKLQRSA